MERSQGFGGARKDLECRLYIEYMDASACLDQVALREYHKLLAYKYRSIKIDAIVVTDNDAFEFMRRFRDAAFPGVPVVFCGVNWFRRDVLDGVPRFTGVADSLITRRPSS